MNGERREEVEREHLTSGTFAYARRWAEKKINNRKITGAKKGDKRPADTCCSGGGGVGSDGGCESKFKEHKGNLRYLIIVAAVDQSASADGENRATDSENRKRRRIRLREVQEEPRSVRVGVGGRIHESSKGDAETVRSTGPGRRSRSSLYCLRTVPCSCSLQPSRADVAFAYYPQCVRVPVRARPSSTDVGKSRRLLALRASTLGIATT